MTPNLKERITAYTSWRQGVLLLAPLEFLLILVVAGLLVMTFVTSLTSTAGKLSMAALKSHLQGLQARLAGTGTIDPVAEREHLEVLFNKVKGSCEGPVISGNKELEELLGQTQTKMEAREEPPSRQRGAWHQWKSVTRSFYELYFPAPVN